MLGGSVSSSFAAKERVVRCGKSSPTRSGSSLRPWPTRRRHTSTCMPNKGRQQSNPGWASGGWIAKKHLRGAWCEGEYIVADVSQRLPCHVQLPKVVRMLKSRLPNRSLAIVLKEEIDAKTSDAKQSSACSILGRSSVHLLLLCQLLLALSFPGILVLQHF
eukprot:scaffold301_cov243-Pinguiococcus_pyrenoidosus.AAC.154